MTTRSCQVVILAAGEGTRMKSALSKVMHTVAGLPMLGHVLRAADAVGASRAAVVNGPAGDDVATLTRTLAPTAEVFTQVDRLGTAHAVLAARAALEDVADDVLVLYGDTPLIRPETLGKLREALELGAAIAVLGFRTANPTGYGRLIVKDDQLAAIREERDASAWERSLNLCNAGVMAFSGPQMLSLLDRIGTDNAKGEYYLTDAVALANADGLRVVVVEAGEDEVRGVNTREELAAVERIWQQAARSAAMAGGATLVAPETVFLSFDTKIGRDVLIEPNVVCGPGVTLDDGAIVHAFCHLEGAILRRGATIGPFARLRPGTMLGDKAKVGNFVEIKNADIAAGAKVNHLSYIGDATVGADANIGAGTITCNYDGVRKYRTEIGAGAFVGSDSALVAPVRIGAGAYIGSGSVITEDVPDGALAIARGRQVNKPGWATAFRAKAAAAKKAD
ncbi:MAG: bifunctional UDP-N-acetylglucosamine diphosphorylase/glucosamine-1-phosphate N-acetyltransferase GlmU [Bauldia sp.]|nr:bifunctional UDP-N-acetylglucosamine diphosphorylase/glucosamine-1-phosphate N-acetyltransferase GlmU [Bauldia sp.]